MNIRKFIPKSLRLQYKLLRRALRDQRSGVSRQWVVGSRQLGDLPYRLEVVQPIKKSHLFENKIHNLKLAGEKLEQYAIQPGEILSFWRAVGAPNRRNGYKKGRNIISGELLEDYGGGLCQLSGIMYQLALKAGLETVERHNHSVDIYTEETRYAPLGTDATVVYGYKDLRLRNPFSFPLRFRFEVEPTQLTAILEAAEPLEAQEIRFERKLKGQREEVLALNGAGEVVSRSTYRKMEGN